MDRRLVLVLAVAVALALGLLAGYLYRRHTSPTLEERMHDAREELKTAVEKLTK